MPHDSIEHLQQIMLDGGRRLFEAGPLALKNILDDRAWKTRDDAKGVPFSSFESFVEHRYWQGLESSVADLRIMCRKHPEICQLIDKAVMPIAGHGEIGGGHAVRDSNTTSANDRGTTYTLKRLKRDRPDLAEKVIARELSANAAAIEAGFRRKMISVPDEVEAAVEAIVRRFGIDAVKRAAQRLQTADP